MIYPLSVKILLLCPTLSLMWDCGKKENYFYVKYNKSYYHLKSVCCDGKELIIPLPTNDID